MTHRIHHPHWQVNELRVLIVDDEPDVLLGLEILARSLGADVNCAACAEEALDTFKAFKPHVVISDITMPGKSGMDLLREIQKLNASTVVILITGFGTIDMAVSALQAGAAHFITKPFDNEEILSSLRRYGDEALLHERVRRLQSTPDGSDDSGDSLIAQDPKMRELLGLAHQVASTPTTVLIEGETGTGKEHIARAIHARSLQRELPFLAVNTAALPDSLLESELFGHRRGAFTGAEQDRKGIFEQANGGTVFLDEVGLMSIPFQDKLLRVLQEKSVTPLGTSTPTSVDFRLVAATSRDLKERIQNDEFHLDLYYRLTVVTLRVPPLRERPDDVLALAGHFLQRYAATLAVQEPPSLSEDALVELQAHDWPGNVRELENSIQRALVLSGGGRIRAHDLRLKDSPAPWCDDLEDVSYEEGKRKAVEHFQRHFIQEALRKTEGNVTRAAERCGLTRAALQRIMRSLRVERASFLNE